MDNQYLNNKIIIYQDNEKNISVDIMYNNETFWMTQKMIAELFNVNIPAISKHLNNIYDEAELTKEAIGIENTKKDMITTFIDEMYFGKFSDFFDIMYNEGYINYPCEISYESSKTFSYIIIACYSTNIEKLKEIVLKYIEQMKISDVDEDLFNIVKRKK